MNSLATINPELAAQAHGWDPATVTAMSNKRLGWICEEGHVWDAIVSNRSKGSGCPIHACRQVLAGYNDLATIDPELAKQANGWNPTTVTAMSNKKLNWICEEGHAWNAAVSDRSRGNGCPYCSGRFAIVGETDLATINPELAAQAHGWDPATVTAMSNKKLDWICEEGHAWDATVNDRSNGKGCPIHSGRQVLAGYNDLATISPELAAQAHGWDPTTVTAGSKQKRRWICKEGHAWDATVSHRSKGSGCPVCNSWGFDPSKPGWLYLMEHPKRGLYQIGISNVIQRRLTAHRGKGWVLISLSAEMPGNVAYDYEQGGRHAVKFRGGIFTDHLGNVKSGGYSEVWTRKSFQLSTIAKLIEIIDADRRDIAAPPFIAAITDVEILA